MLLSCVVRPSPTFSPIKILLVADDVKLVPVLFVKLLKLLVATISVPPPPPPAVPFLF
jgi:hypothetical protein